MPAKGPGGGTTSFENMTHEQMLTWLDQANSGHVQAAAERLLAAAKAIRDIAEELKIRPQWVAWKGEGADAFRTWTADLANSTLRLGDFSDDAAKWLTEASWAIARAQASIPREVPGDVQTLQANVDAARAAHNDPDAAIAATQAEQELQALTSRKEQARLQAAAQMRKLAQTYSWSAMQMSALERPKFPPPPDAIVPDPALSVDRKDIDKTPAGGSVSAGSSSIESTSSVNPRTEQPISGTRYVSEISRVSTALPHVTGEVPPPTRMVIDSVTTTPQFPHAPTDSVNSPSFPEQARREPVTIPPTFGSSRGASSVQPPGRPVPGAAGPVRAVTGPSRQGAPIAGPLAPGPGQPVTGRSPLGPVPGMPPATSGRGPSSPVNGIVGGRPVTPPTGRPTGAIPRGVVVGGEAAPARGPVGPTVGTANPAGRVIGQPGQVADRRLPPPNAPVVGGRPLPHNGIVSKTPQQGPAGTPTDRSSGPATTGGASAVRGGVFGSATNTARPGDSNGTSRPRSPQPTYPAINGNRGGQPHRGEDEENRQQNHRRTRPPVID